MSYPSSIDAPDTTMQGTNLVTSPDHSLNHRQLGSAVIAVETVVGATSGTNVLKNFSAGNFPARINSSNVLQQIITGTVNSSVMGTPTITGGIFNNGAIGTSLMTGGTISAPLINTHSIGSATSTGTVSGTITLDLGTASRHLINMPNTAGNITLAVSNVVVNRPFITEIMQGTSGLGTIVWFSTIRWDGGAAPTLTATASKKDTFGFMPTGAATFDGYICGQAL